MRSHPSCWNKTLTKLGFKRKFRKTKPEFTRRARFEPLEQRQMLSASSWSETELTVDTAEIASLVPTDSSKGDLSRQQFFVVSGASKDLFTVTTDYNESGSPAAILEFNNPEKLPGHEYSLQHEIILELREGRQNISRHRVVVTLASDEFLTAYRQDRLENAQNLSAAGTTEDADNLLEKLTPAGDFSDLAPSDPADSINKEQTKTELDRFASLAEAISKGKVSADSRDSRLRLYAGLDLASEKVNTLERDAKTAELEVKEGRRDANAPRIHPEEAKAQKEKLGKIAIQLADQIRTDLASADVEVANAAQQVRDQFVANARFTDLLWKGYGANSNVVQSKADSKGEVHYSVIYETGQVQLTDQIAIDVGQAAVIDMTETPLSPGFRSFASSAGVTAGPNPNVGTEADTFVWSLQDPTNPVGSDPHINVGHGVGIEFEGLFRFDVSSFSQYTTTATVELTPNSWITGSSFEHSAEVVDDNWYEATTTWTDRPAENPASPVLTTTGASSWTIASNDASTISLDVSEQVRKKLRQGDLNFDSTKGNTGTASDVTADVTAFELAVKDRAAFDELYIGYSIDEDDVIDRADIDGDGEITTADAEGFIASHGFLRADTNFDGSIDGTSGFLHLQGVMGQTVSYFEGDYDFSGIVDGDDVDIWSEDHDAAQPNPAEEKLSLRLFAANPAPTSLEYVGYASKENTNSNARPNLIVDQDPSVVLNRFDSTTENFLQVNYSILNEAVTSFDVEIYRSADGITPDANGLLMTYSETDASKMQPGLAQQIKFEADFSTLDNDVSEDYYLVAKIVSNASIGQVESGVVNFAGGTFQETDGTLQVHGTDGTDIIDVSTGFIPGQAPGAHNAPVPAINFSDHTLLSYGGTGQDKTPDNNQILDDGNKLRLWGNTWKAIELDIPYQVTANTILEFDFESTDIGQIHGVGFSNSTSTLSPKTFQVYGTQYGVENHDHHNYKPENNVQHYRIRVGDHFTGTFDYLTFANDEDVAGETGESIFSNVRVYEDRTPINFANYTNVNYGGGQTRIVNGHVPSYIADGSSITLENNVWQAIPYSYRVTENTVVEFDYSSTIEGEIHGFGFDDDLNVTETREIVLHGTQANTFGWHDILPEYELSEGTRRYRIHVGERYTGDFEHLFFFVDNDNANTGNGNSTFSNFRVFESDPTVVDFRDQPLQSYGGGQDATPNNNDILDDGNKLHLWGDTWKAIDFQYDVTRNTILEFDFESTSESEIHGIGFEDDLTITDPYHFQVHGSQNSNALHAYDNYNPANGVQHYRIPVGQFYTGEFEYLFFSNDDDEGTGTGGGFFSNVRVYEGPTVFDPISITYVRSHGGDDLVEGDNAYVGTSYLFGGADNDTLRGGGGSNYFYGSSGDDQVIVTQLSPNLASGTQLLFEGEGDDTYEFEAGQKGFTAIVPDTDSTPDGNDTLDFSQLDLGIDLLDLNTNSNTLNSNLVIFYDLTTNIENVIGTAYEDEIIGNDLDNILIGGDGDDTLNGREGVDVLFGDAGADTFLVDPVESYIDDSVIDSDQTVIIEDSGGNTNEVPAIDSIIEPPEAANVVDGTVISIDLVPYVSDPNAGQSLTFAPIAPLPIGANLSSVGMFAWTPTIDQAGKAYSIEFSVSDDHGVIPLKDESRFWIYVDFAIPNQAPTIADQTLPNAIAEDSSNGTVVGTVVASDPNSYDTLGYTIIGGNGDGIFAIDSNGQITVANSSSLDYEQATSHQLIVQIVDNGIPQLSSTANVTVNVSDVADGEAPELDSINLEVRYGLSDAIRVMGTDAEDSPEQLSYTLLSLVDSTGNPSGGGNLNSDDVFHWWGQQEVGTYTATIEVTDTDGNSDTGEINIEVTDYNRSSPSLTGLPSSPPFGIYGGTDGDGATHPRFYFAFDNDGYWWPREYSNSHPASPNTLILVYNESSSAPGPPPSQVHVLLSQAIDTQTASEDLTYVLLDGPGSINQDGYYTQDLASTKGTSSRVEIAIEDDGADGDPTVRRTHVRTFYVDVSHLKDEVNCNEDVPHWHEDYDWCSSMWNSPITARDAFRSTSVNTPVSGHVPSPFQYSASYIVDSFSVASGPQNGTITDYDAETGDFTYVPNTDFRGVDSFTYKISGERRELLDDVREIPPTTTSDDAVVTINVGPDRSVDIDTDVPDEDEAQFPGQQLYVGGDPVEISLSTWLREDLYPNDYKVWLSSTSGGFRIWESASRENEIIPRIGTLGGTQWMFDDMPDSVFIEATHAGALNLTLSMNGLSDTVVFTAEDSFDFNALFYRNGSGGGAFDPQEDENEIIWNLDRDEDNNATGPHPDDPGQQSLYPILDYMKDDNKTHAESLKINDDELVRMDLTVQNWPSGSDAEWKVDFTTEKVRLYYQDPNNGDAITELSSGSWINAGEPGAGLVASVYIEAIDKSANLKDITINPHVRDTGTGVTKNEENFLTSIVGDLNITQIDPVQVLYDVPMVIDKATLASVLIDWTSPYSAFTDGAWVDDVKVKLLNVPGVGTAGGGGSDIEEEFTIYKFPSATKPFFAIPYEMPGVPGEIPIGTTDTKFRRTLLETTSDLRKQGFNTANLGVFHPNQSQKLSAEIDSGNALLEHEENNNEYTTPQAFQVRQFKHQLFQIDYGYATWGIINSGDVEDFNVPPSKANAKLILDPQFADLIALSPIPKSKVVYNYLGVKQESSYPQGIVGLNSIDTLGTILDSKYRVGDVSTWILADEDALAGTTIFDGYNPRQTTDNKAVFIAESAPRQILAHEFGHDIHGLGHPEGPASKGWNVERFANPTSPLWVGSDGFANGKAARVFDTTLENYMVDVAGGKLTWATQEQYLQLLEYYTTPVAAPPPPPSPQFASVTFSADPDPKINVTQPLGVLDTTIVGLEGSLSEEKKTPLQSVAFETIDLPYNLLGQGSYSTNQIAINASEDKWQFDGPSYRSMEFEGTSKANKLRAVSASVANHPVDMSTNSIDELGLGHSVDDEHNLISKSLASEIRVRSDQIEELVAKDSFFESLEKGL